MESARDIMQRTALLKRLRIANRSVTDQQTPPCTIVELKTATIQVRMAVKGEDNGTR